MFHVERLMNPYRDITNRNCAEMLCLALGDSGRTTQQLEMLRAITKIDKTSSESADKQQTYAVLQLIKEISTVRKDSTCEIFFKAFLMYPIEVRLICACDVYTHNILICSRVKDFFEKRDVL